MQVIKKAVSPSEVMLTVTVDSTDVIPHLEKTAKELSESMKIEGFRPGHAPYEVVKQRVGEMELYKQAIDNIVHTTLAQAMKQELADAHVVGHPDVNVEKLAPGNPVVYTATIFLVPSVKVGNYGKIKLERKPVAIDDKNVDQTMANLRRMKATEKPKALTPVAKGDKATINLEVFMDRVPIEGGQQNNYPIVIGEGSFIPGFEEQLIGMTKGQKKEFSLPFPKDYHEKKLAGKLADFRVELMDVVGFELPPVDDAFAKEFGHQTAEELRKAIAESLEVDQQRKEDQRLEVALLDALVKITDFGPIPDKLVTDEARIMLHELEEGIRQQGMSFDHYLEHLKKTPDDLLKEFRPQALQRIKTALCLRTVAEQVAITVTDADLDEEVSRLKRMAEQTNPATLENISAPAYRRYLESMLKNRQTIAYLKEKVMIK